MHRLYTARRSLLLTSLAKDFPASLRAIPNEAGLHVTAMLAPGLSARELAQAARSVGVGIYDVAPSPSTMSSSSCVVFGFGRTDEADIVEGMSRLRRLLAGRPGDGSARVRRPGSARTGGLERPGS